MGNNSSSEFTSAEQMTVSASRLIRNGDVVYTGVGLPTVAAFLAKLSHAPEATIIFETGIITTDSCEVPYGVDNLNTQHIADMLEDVFFVNSLGQSGHVDIGLIGAGQVDCLGNFNSTCIGDYNNTVLRFPGSGGAIDIVAFSKRIVFMIPHRARRLPNKVDFMSGTIRSGSHSLPNELSTVQEREAHIVTDLGVFSFGREGFNLDSIHKGVTIEEVVRNTGWEIKPANCHGSTGLPTKEELCALREKVDPNKVFTSGMMIL